MNKKWSYTDLNAVHLELSSKCNAACPGCPRHLRNSPNVDTNLIQKDISITDFKNWFSPDTLSKIQQWTICGTHGDPMTCNDLVKIVKYICAHSNGSIQINTNGGLRGTKFFSDLGKVIAESQIENITREVVFSIDGLADTNHIYRRQVKWNKVMDNLRAYVNAGGQAAWDFLRFKHNTHQIAEAQSIAMAMGVDFRLKNPFGVDVTGMPVYDRDYNLEYVIHHHSIDPTQEPYVPAGIGYSAPMPEIIAQTEGYVECNSFRSHLPPFHDNKMCEVYIDHMGSVQPCCFVGNKMYGPSYVNESTEVKNIQKKMGNKNNLYHYNLKDILDAGILEIYSQSWTDKSINQCWLQCGKNQNKKRCIDTLFEED
jgi:hypothetical protein